MTQAVCFECGEIKWGAFNNCRQCQAIPRTDDELMLSLAFTDHYFEWDKLQQISQSIKDGITPQLTNAWKEQLAPAVQEAKRMLGIDRDARKVLPRSKRGHLLNLFGPTRFRILFALLPVIGLAAIAALWITNHQYQARKSPSIDDEFHLATAKYRDHDYDYVAEIMRPLAEAGDVNAQVNLVNALDGLMTQLALQKLQMDKEELKEEERNLKEEGLKLKEEELKYLCLAALQDDAEAQNSLGYWVYKPNNEGNNAEAVFWWQQAVKNSYPPALYQMARDIHFGLSGLSKDDKKAVGMLRKAAEMGHDDAQLNLADIYWDGEGNADPPWTTVRQDYSEAAKWYLAAAKRGNTFAQEKIGLMYYRGIALTQNFAEAYFWLNLATSDSIVNYMADKRSDFAQQLNAFKKMRDEAGSRLATERLNQIQDQLKNWSALPSARHDEQYVWRDHPAVHSERRTMDDLPTWSICSQ
jgi:TPR repeat protein